MTNDHRQIARTIRWVRWVQRIVGLLEATLVFFVALLVCLLALTLLPASLVQQATPRVMALAVALALPAAVAVYWLLRTPSLHQTETQCAIAVERACGHPHNAVINALQLGREALAGSPDIIVSAPIVERLVQRTRAALAASSPLAAVDSTRLRRLAASAAAAGLVSALAWLAAPDAIGRAWVSLLRPWDEIHGLRYRLGKSPAPTVGDICLTFHYPLYTGLRPRMVPGATGHVAAVKGTEVEIQASASVPVRRAQLLLSNGQSVPLQVAADAVSLSGRLVVIESGTYRFKLTPQDGPAALAERTYTITAEEDLPPHVRFTSGSEKTEVAETGRLELHYRAADDFGVAKLRLVVRRGKDETRTLLKRFEPAVKRHADAYAWDLAPLNLRQGERVVYWLEAEDEDSVSGPNVGRSQARQLEVFSERRKHKRLVELQEQLRKAMVHLLADELVTLPDRPPCSTSVERLLIAQGNIAERRDTVLALFENILGQMQRGEVGNYAHFEALRNMRERLEEHSQTRRALLGEARRAGEPGLDRYPGLIATAQQREVEELERDLLFLADMIDRQRADDVARQADDLLSRQRDIVDLLERMAKGSPQDMSREAQALLAEIQRMLAEMMAEMAKMAPRLPQEFANADASANQSQQAMQEQIRKMLEEFERGNMKAALEAARAMLQELAKMRDAWRKSAQQFADNRYGKELAKLRQMQRELSDLERKQHALAQQTNEIKRATQRRAFTLMKQNLDAFFKKQLERLDRMLAALDEAKGAGADNAAARQYATTYRAFRDALGRQARIFQALRDATTPGARKRLLDQLRSTDQMQIQLADSVARRPVLRFMFDTSQRIDAARGDAGKLRTALTAWDVGESLPLAEGLEFDTSQWSRQLAALAKDAKLAAEGKARATATQPHLDTAAAAAHAIAEDLRKLRRNLDSMRQQTMTEEEGKQLKGIAQEQAGLRKRTQSLQQRLKQSAAKLPFMNPRASRLLGGAARAMGQAEDNLGRGRAGQGLADQREAGARLAEAKQMMKQGEKMCQQGMMQGSMPMPRGQRLGEGGLRPGTRRVEIPGEDAYRVPKRFRQDIIDAMKQGLPPRYRDLNREYYRKLLE